MRLTIIVSGGVVAVNGAAHEGLDLSLCGVPPGVHALQWYDTHGEVEFSRIFTDGVFVHPANEVVVALPEWAECAKLQWAAAEQAAAEQAAAEQAAAEQAAADARTT